MAEESRRYGKEQGTMRYLKKVQGRQMGTRGKRIPAIQHNNQIGSSPESMPV
jgi:hypothetical protein